MSEKTTTTSVGRGLLQLFKFLGDWIGKRVRALAAAIDRLDQKDRSRSDVLDRSDLEGLVFFLEGRVQDLELRLDGMQAGRGVGGTDTSERVEALVTTVAVLTKSVVQLSLQAQHLYDELGMDPNDPLEDIFFSAGEGLDDEEDEPTGGGSSSGGFGGGLGGMIN